MATRRTQKIKDFTSLPPQVPLSIDTFAAIVDAGRIMSDSTKYIDDPLMRTEVVFISNAILEHGKCGLKDIEIARDPKRKSEKSTSRALVPLPFFMAISIGVRLFVTYMETRMPTMPEEEKKSALNTLRNSLQAFEDAKLEGLKDQDRIAQVMKHLIEHLEDNIEDIESNSNKNSIN